MTQLPGQRGTYTEHHTLRVFAIPLTMEWMNNTDPDVLYLPPAHSLARARLRVAARGTFPDYPSGPLYQCAEDGEYCVVAPHEIRFRVESGLAHSREFDQMLRILGDNCVACVRASCFFDYHYYLFYPKTGVSLFSTMNTLAALEYAPGKKPHVSVCMQNLGEEQSAALIKLAARPAPPQSN